MLHFYETCGTKFTLKYRLVNKNQLKYDTLDNCNMSVSENVLNPLKFAIKMTRFFLLINIEENNLEPKTKNLYNKIFYWLFVQRVFMYIYFLYLYIYLFSFVYVYILLL